MTERILLALIRALAAAASPAQIDPVKVLFLGNHLTRRSMRTQAGKSARNC